MIFNLALVDDGQKWTKNRVFLRFFENSTREFVVQLNEKLVLCIEVENQMKKISKILSCDLIGGQLRPNRGAPLIGGYPPRAWTTQISVEKNGRLLR